MKVTTAVRVFTLLAFIPILNAAACRLEISAGQQTPGSGTADTITVRFTQTHRNCTLQPDATKFETIGMEIVDRSEWKAVRDHIYERIFQVEYTDKGTAEFKATRNCPKKGEQSKTFEIEVQ